MNNPYLLPALRLSPALMARLIERIDPALHDERLDPERFTLREVLAHLADWEPILRARIEQGVAQPGSSLVAYDEEERARSQRYAELSVEGSLRQWTAEREKTVAVVASIPRDGFEHIVLHPERGPMSVADLAGFIPNHDLYHLEQVSAYLPGATGSFDSVDRAH